MAVTRLNEKPEPQHVKKDGQRIRIADFIKNFRVIASKSNLDKKLESQDTIYGHDLAAQELFSDFLNIPKIPEDEVDVRVLNSEAIHLFALLSSGVLDNEPDLEKQITLAEQFLARVSAKNKEKQMSHLQERGIDPISIGIEMKYGKHSGTTVGSSLTKFGGVYKEGINVKKNVERQTEPSVSARTFLREILTTMKLGWQPDTWIIHETASVLLDEEHTEIMDITAMQVAAGLLFPDSAPIGKRERFPKPNRDRDHYFPFHKPRSRNQLIDKMKPYVNNNGNHTEMRSLIQHKPIEYSRLVRQVTFFYLSCYGIQAYQLEPTMRSPLEDKLAEHFQTLLIRWNNLLKSAKIHNPTNDERYTYFEPILDTEPDKIPYNHLINVLSARHDRVLEDGMTLRQKTRELIRDYNHQVRAILDY